ncbi:hypothetical protein AB0O87_05800 [Microbacterium sp. NPDC076768]|uniref:hypothetical protein n=1 Tax=Microbacterium sp. NPDC076768 TaxID=3154858 RepID=UPI003438CC37
MSGVLIIIVSVFDLPMAGGRFLVSGPIVLGVTGLVLLGWMVGELRKPLGLTLDERGLRGVRESASIDVEWDDIVRVSTCGPHKAQVMVQLRDGGRKVVGGTQIGSDPTFVAAIIEYYRLHPAERIHLSDGPGAIRAVEARANQ